MNLELLLEKNNIHFTPKNQNFRCLVSRLFNSKEEPDVLDSTNHNNVDSCTKPNECDENGENQNTGSWTDVKEMFDSLNCAELRIQQNYQKRNSKHQASSSTEKHRLPHLNEFEKNVGGKSDIAIDLDMKVKHLQLMENKENIKDKTEHPKNSDFDHSNVANAIISSSSNHNKSISSNNDLPNRVRPVNVEMYTVTLGQKKGHK